jgi:hypothetical protein
VVSQPWVSSRGEAGQCGGNQRVRGNNFDPEALLDISRWAVMLQVTPGTLLRAPRKEKLWNGNRETFRYLFTLTDEHILRWAWKTHAKNRKAYRAAFLESKWSHIKFIHLKTKAEINSFQTST